MPQRTVRELVGEIWAELGYEADDTSARGETTFENYDVPPIGTITDVILGVLARYDGFEIVNDADLPVTARPIRHFPET